MKQSKKNNHRSLIMVIALIVYFSGLVTLATNTYAETKSAIVPAQENSKQAKKNSTSNKARQFIPTEKIKADTSVPFPVDI